MKPQYFKTELRSCRDVDGATGCATASKIAAAIDSTILDIYLLNYFFDTKDFKGVAVKPYIENFYMPLVKDFGQAKVFTVEKHLSEKKDHWSGFLPR